MNQMSMPDQQLKAALPTEITGHLHQLFSSLPQKGGDDPVAVMNGYVIAVRGMPEWAIGRAVDKFISGLVPGQSDKFCPRAPEFAAAVRSVRDTAMADSAKPETGGRYYSFKKPQSAVLERRCTKDWGRQLVTRGVHPKGSIWIPGDLGDNNQHLGTLFAPDEEWQQAQSIERTVS